MPPIITECFILKKINFRETSVILTLFTKELGKIKGILKGVRKEGSKISPLTFSEGAYISTFVYKKKSELNLLSSPTLLKFFYFKDKDSFKVYFHILKLIDVFTPDLEKEESIFYLIKEIAETLETNKKQYLLFLAFKLRFIEILGYGIKLDKCCICEKEMERYFFSPKKGGVICKNCNKEDPNCVKISKKIISIMRFIKKIEIKNVEVLNIKKIDAEKINYLCNLTLYYHTNLNFIWWKNEKNIFR